MNKIFPILIICLFLSLNISAQSQQPSNNKINWMSWDQAIKIQKNDLQVYNDKTIPKTKKKPPKKIFVDVYTSWCGWCKKMDATTFKDPTVVKYMNKHFYPVKFNAERKDSIVFNNHTFINPNPAGRRSSHQFAASLLNNKLSYPSYAILDENTNRLAIYAGYKRSEALLTIIKFFGSNQYLTYKKYLEKEFKQDQKNKETGK